MLSIRPKASAKPDAGPPPESGGLARLVNSAGRIGLNLLQRMAQAASAEDFTAASTGGIRTSIRWHSPTRRTRRTYRGPLPSVPDFRDVFGTVLKHWLAIPEPTILASILPPDAGDPSTYWTDPDFDLGFLP